MADVVVARIQNRRGLRRDLPQPLAPGEIGFCTDTGEMFIGTDIDPNGFIAPVLELYTPSSANNQLVNTYTSTQLVQVTLDDPEIDVPDVGDISILSNGKLYVGYSSQPSDLPGLGLGEERWFTDLNMDPVNEFQQGTLALDDSIYNVDDASAISEVINFIDNGIGIVTVSQNVQIWTRSSDINLLSNSIEFPSIRIPLPAGPQPDWVKIPQSVYDFRDSDTFIIEYGIAGEVSSGTNIPNYNRTGSIRITATPNKAILTDSYTEESQSNIQLSFEARKEGNEVSIWFRTSSSIPPDEQFYLTTNTRRWKTFKSDQGSDTPVPPTSNVFDISIVAEPETLIGSATAGNVINFNYNRNAGNINPRLITTPVSEVQLESLYYNDFTTNYIVMSLLDDEPLPGNNIQLKYDNDKNSTFTFNSNLGVNGAWFNTDTELSQYLRDNRTYTVSMEIIFV